MPSRHKLTALLAAAALGASGVAACGEEDAEEAGQDAQQQLEDTGQDAEDAAGGGEDY